MPRGDVVFLGTTDTSYAGGAERVAARSTRADVEYLLAPASRDFDVVAARGRPTCVTAWAGLRPLIAEPGKAARGDVAQGRDRGSGRLGVVTLAGGKLTGYRPMARARSGASPRCAGLRSPRPARSRRSPGGDFDGDLDGLAARARGASAGARRADAPRASRASTAARRATVLRSAREPLAPGRARRRRRGRLGGRRARAPRPLEDVLYRRTRAALYDPDAREAALAPAAARMARAPRLERRAARRDELARARARLARGSRLRGGRTVSGIAERLRAALGADAVRTEPEALARHRRDTWVLVGAARPRGRGAPRAAPRWSSPRATEEVVGGAARCAARRARRSCPSAAARASAAACSRPTGAVVLSTRRLDGLVALDDARSARELPRRHERHGRRAPRRRRPASRIGHWPQSIELSTVGGWVATRAAGQLSTAYGNIEDLLFALEVVLPDGSVRAHARDAARRRRAPTCASSSSAARARSASSPR